ncbi:MAG: Gfo/Idh/MocA family oxidoreductase [Chloroflexi bacterium]|nr:Gfo/Idh/MocA family oxidoreductase [Chloroflexota bacterium]
MTAPLRVGLIGAGWMGHVHAQSWAANAPRGEITAVFDTSDDRARALVDARTNGRARVYKDLGGLLADAEIDAVDICLPHHLHADAIVRAASAGKHALCEKPICLTFEELRAIRRAVDDAGITFMTAHNNLFALPLIEARRMLGDGTLGRVMHIRSNEVGRNSGMRQRRSPVAHLPAAEATYAWRLDPVRMGGAELLDTGYHGAYRLLGLAASASGDFEDRPIEVVAMLGNYYMEELRPGEDTASVLVRFASGVQGVLVTSWAFGDVAPAWQFEVAGHLGSLAGNVTRLVHAAHGWSSPAERVWQTAHSETYTREVTHFLDVLREDAAPLASWQHAARTLQLIRAAYRSAEERRIIPIPEDPATL